MLLESKSMWRHELLWNLDYITCVIKFVDLVLCMYELVFVELLLLLLLAVGFLVSLVRVKTRRTQPKTTQFVTKIKQAGPKKVP